MSLALRLGDTKSAILWESENEAVECALGSGRLSPVLEDKKLLGCGDDWE